MAVPQLEAEIVATQEMCDERYQLDTSHKPLPTHHLANMNIIYGYIHQLFLLLLRPSLSRYLQGEVTPETCASRAKCVASSKASLAIYQVLFESPQFVPYKWYNSGLGSFHAFHAAVVLSVILMNPESQAEFAEIKDILWKSLDIFAALSNRSAFCSKAVPVLRQVIDVATSRYQQRIIKTSPTPILSPSATPYQHHPHPHPHLQPESQYHPHSVPVIVQENPMDPFFAQMHAQNWVSPSAIPWDGWGFLTAEQYGLHQGVG